MIARSKDDETEFAISPPTNPPTSDGGASHQNIAQLMRPSRMCFVAAVAAATALIATFAPPPAATAAAIETAAGKLILPSTRPATPPATATVKQSTAKPINSRVWQ